MSIRPQILVVFFLSIGSVIAFYFATSIFSFVSPRGFPLTPLEDLYWINDFEFYEDYALGLPSVLFEEVRMRAPLLFSFFIALVYAAGLSEGHLSPIFLSLIYIVLAGVYLLARSRGAEEAFPYLMLGSPYFFYFSVFPSSDMLMAVFLVALIVLVVIRQRLKTEEWPILLGIMGLSVLISLSRAQGLVYLIIPLLVGLSVFSHRNVNSQIKGLTLCICAILMLVFSVTYYIDVFNVYVRSSSGYLNQENISEWMSSPIGKFLSSFGIRQSFLTVYDEGISKPLFYIFARLSLGIVLVTGFFICLFKAYLGHFESRVVLLVYVLSLAAAWGGVSFERYFLTPGFFFFHYALKYPVHLSGRIVQKCFK